MPSVDIYTHLGFQATAWCHRNSKYLAKSQVLQNLLFLSANFLSLTCWPSFRLQLSYYALLEASKAFFDLPVTEKQKYKTVEGTEEGWSHVPGEKEFITLRTLDNTPPELKEVASNFWAEGGGFLNTLLVNVYIVHNYTYLVCHPLSY